MTLCHEYETEEARREELKARREKAMKDLREAKTPEARDEAFWRWGDIWEELRATLDRLRELDLSLRYEAEDAR